MRQAHKGMNPVTAAALNSFGLVKTLDAMLVRGPFRFKLKIKARIPKAWLVKK